MIVLRLSQRWRVDEYAARGSMRKQARPGTMTSTRPMPRRAAAARRLRRAGRGSSGCSRTCPTRIRSVLNHRSAAGASCRRAPHGSPRTVLLSGNTPPTSCWIPRRANRPEATEAAALRHNRNRAPARELRRRTPQVEASNRLAQPHAIALSDRMAGAVVIHHAEGRSRAQHAVRPSLSRAVAVLPGRCVAQRR